MDQITERQAIVLKESYVALSSDSQNGFKVLLRMLDEHPSYKLLWPTLRQVHDSALVGSQELLHLAKVYMQGLDEIIGSLNDALALETKLRKIAHTHKVKGITKKHVDNMLPCLLVVLKSEYAKYDKATEDAWTNLFDAFTNIIEEYKSDIKD